jgi:hypothetical protein
MGTSGRLGRDAPSQIDRASIYTGEMSITVDLPDDALQRLQAEADRRGVPIEQLIIEFSRQFAQEPPAGRRLSFIGLGRSTTGRTAREADEMLEEGFGRS